MGKFQSQQRCQCCSGDWRTMSAGEADGAAEQEMYKRVWHGAVPILLELSPFGRAGHIVECPDGALAARRHRRYPRSGCREHGDRLPARHSIVARGFADGSSTCQTAHRWRDTAEATAQPELEWTGELD